MEKENCEHELVNIEEKWDSNSIIEIKMNCSLCEEIFTGVLVR